MIRAPWTSKPWLNVGVDADNPLGSRLLAAFALNEGAGAAVQNAAGTESLAISGLTASWAATPSGPGLAFTGVAAQAVLPADARYRPAAGLTYAARVSPSSSSASANIIRCDDGATNRIALLDIPSLVPRMIGFATGSNVTVTGATTLVVGRWYDLAATFDATTKVVNVYVNGVLDGTGTATGTIYRGTAPAVTYLGKATASNVSAMLGSVAHWMIFGGALSASDVASLAANPWQVFQPRVTFLRPAAGAARFRRSLYLRTGSRGNM